MHLKRTILLLLALLLCFGCVTDDRRSAAPPAPDASATPGDAKADVFTAWLGALHERRGRMLESFSSVEDEDIMCDLSQREVPDFASFLIGSCDYKPKGNDKDISIEEAQFDIDLYFEALPFVYSGYLAMGGDELFHAAKQRILDDLPEEDSAINGRELCALLAKHLSFVNDTHYQIYLAEQAETGGAKQASYMEEIVMYFPDDALYFDMAKNAYVDASTGEELVSVDGDGDVGRYMRASIDEKGEIHHTLCILKEKSEGTAMCRLGLRGKDGAVRTQNILLSRAKATYNKTGIDWRGDIPILSFPTYSSRMSKEEHRVIQESAALIRDAKAAILDLRGNSGGAPFFFAWMQAWAGEPPGEPGHYTVRAGGILDSYMQKQEPSDESEYDFSHLHLSGRSGVDAVWFKTRQTIPKTCRENDQLLFVLMDKATASAAEWHILSLMQYENVVFVGSNTKGALQGREGDSFLFMALPHSGIALPVPMTFMGLPASLFSDGRGFLPDLFLPPDIALERVLLLAENVCE